MDSFLPAVVDPQSPLPQAFRYNRSDLKRIAAYSKTCSGDLTEVSDTTLAKTVLWEKHRCGQLANLPPNFFLHPPYFHPQGVSFAALAAKSGAQTFNNPNWLYRHKELFHVKERKTFFNEQDLSQSEKVLADLNPSDLEALRTRDSLILTPKHAIIRSRKTHTGQSLPLFHSFEKKKLIEFLKDQEFFLAPQKGIENCFEVGNSCWRSSPKTTNPVVSLAAGALSFTGAAGLLSTVVYALVRSLLDRRRLSQDRRRMLQILAHEIRTPVANLKLIVESFRKNFDDLPETSQKDFLDLCDEVQRVEKVAVSSENFIRATDNYRSKFQIRRVNLGDVIQDVIAPWQEAVEYSGTTPSVFTDTDPDWLALCLSNLIDNAIRHGEPPFKVKVSDCAPLLKVSIESGGNIVSKDLNQLSRPFSRKGPSGGFGLGLHIVRSTLRDLHGNLSLETNPTVFTITLRKAK